MDRTLRRIGGLLADHREARCGTDKALRRAGRRRPAELKDHVGGMLLGESLIHQQCLACAQDTGSPKPGEGLGEQRPAEMRREVRDGLGVALDLTGDHNASLGEQEISQRFDVVRRCCQILFRLRVGLAEIDLGARRRQRLVERKVDVDGPLRGRFERAARERAPHLRRVHVRARHAGFHEHAHVTAVELVLVDRLIGAGPT